MNGGSAQIKLRGGSRLLVTTRLCEAMLKSKTGHEFDSGQSQERRHVFEYNQLQDPYLKDYFYRPAMKERLIANNFITPDLKVIGPPRSYNAYRRFLEDEVAKIRIGKELELKEKENKKSRPTTYRRMGRYTLIDQARDEKKRLYLQKQERIVLAKWYALEKEDMRIKLQRRKELEQQHIQRVKNELKKHSRDAMAKLKYLQKKLLQELSLEEETAKKSSDASQQKVVEEELKTVQDSANKNGEHLESIKEFESRWVESLEDSSKDDKEEIEKKKEQLKKHDDELKEREKAIVTKDIDEKEHKQKPPLESYLWLHLLAQQADIREREWGEIRRCGLEGWEAVRRQWDQLQVQLRLRREAWRTEHVKLLSSLLSEQPSQGLRKLVVTYKKSASSDEKMGAGDAPEKSTSKRAPGSKVVLQVKNFND